MTPELPAAPSTAGHRPAARLHEAPCDAVFAKARLAGDPRMD
jgi:hypothetical protein